MQLSSVLFVLCLPAMAAQGPTLVKLFPASGSLRFELRDHLDHPYYWWPRTLLNYPVRFDQAKVKRADLRLLNSGTTDAVPFQLSSVKESGGYLQSAVVSFFADLPAGSARTFVLSTGGGAPSAQQVKESREGESIILDTGVMRVCIPASRSVNGPAPGPILQAARGSDWFGSSRIISPNRAVESITTTREESGPLFVTYKISYSFQRGARYTATVRAVAGYDFVYLFEEMQGIEPQEGIHVQMDWTGFQPTHRQAPNHPYQRENPERGYGRYNWETIDQGTVSTQHGVSAGLNAEGEFPFRLGPYQPWGAYIMLTSANFWDERANNAIGIFIDRVNRWQDHEYAIWASSNKLQVRYFYANGMLTWKSPLCTGTRSTGIAVYDHRKDIESMETLDKLATAPVKYRDGLTYRARLSPMSHTMFLQNRFGTIDLDMVKDWVLEYPAGAKRPPVIFSDGAVKTAAELEQRVFTTELTRDLPTQGTRQNAGFAPVPSRNIYGWFIDGYNRLYAKLTERQRERITAMYLMMAYTHGEEEYMPLRTMISGHPNFLSDVKSAPALFAFLFPEHPMAQEWADQFEKFLQLNTRYHTRPEVQSWDARGGRWTENLGTYVWAFLRPAMHAEFALRQSVDEKNRLAIPQIAQIGDWLVNALSAPFNGEDPTPYLGPDGKLPRHYWGMVTRENGPRRLHPPQGAHSARRMPPKSMWLLGRSLLNYDPLKAEHMMWAARPGDDDAEHAKDLLDPWDVMYRGGDNRGTNPHLKSSKYTGYGITLRASVDTPEELSVHLQQIDEGPNYRWGIAGEGGCGVVYYYAQGKSFSHNAREDVGDRAAHDTDFSSNFGVWKSGQFKSIGRNVLERPLYDLGVAQFAEIVPRKSGQTYSWPEYQSRSVLLVGSDYFVIYDDVFNDAVAHRFSWFTQANDDMPFIHMVRGGVRERERLASQIITGPTKGVWYDGMGDSMAVVSHRKDVTVQNTPFGARVKTGAGEDLVFFDPEGVRYAQGESAFSGTAGIIRNRRDGVSEIALFHGSSIRHRGLTIAVDNTDLAVGATIRNQREITGTLSSLKGGQLRISLATGAAQPALYIDGVKQTGLQVQVPAGADTWEITDSLPFPNSPIVLRTENRSGDATVHFNAVAGAASYRVEVSRDGGASWTVAGTTASSPYRLANLANNTKLHVRLIAVNEKRQSAPGLEYPVYVTNQKPPHPDGLRLTLAKDSVSLSWGEVLGASGYQLYRRPRGTAQFEKVHSGTGRAYVDNAPGVIPALDEPGASANAVREIPPHRIYEYAVAAVNGNGEGGLSSPVSTDPASWVNWDPKPGERFRRRYTYNTSNYLVLGREEDIQRYYPK